MRIAPMMAWIAAGSLASVANAIQPVGYRVLTGSQETQRFCLPPCLCPYHEFTGATTGTFTLEQTLVDPLFIHYSVTGLHFVSVINGADVVVDGYGSYRRGGEVAIQQELILDVTVNGVAAHYDSGLVAADVSHPFPEISITTMTAVAACRQDVLNIL